MNTYIMEAPSTNIFVKMGKGIKKGIYAFFGSAWSVVFLVILILFMILKIIDYLDNKAYPEGNYEMVYRVYYTPTTVKEYKIRHNRPIVVGSDRGTNYIRKYNEGTIINTSAPIEIVKYVKYDR